MNFQSPSLPKSYFIKTFGCQMNVADTERMSALLYGMGMSSVETPETADLILINGCTVREKAVHKALSVLGKYRHERGDREPPLIGVGGCVGQLDKQTLFAKVPGLDFVFGTDTIDSLPEIIHRVSHGERKVVFTDFDSSQNYSTETKIIGAQAQAFVNIMKGCDKYCSYCIVPFTRGKEKSRTIQEVLDDLANLVKRGVREVTLLGQNVNSFGKGNPNTQGLEPRELHNQIGKVGPREGEENFPQLLWAIDADPRLEALKRVRFTSSHPLDFSDELIECYHQKTGVKKLAQHLHLPVQSGSDYLLQKMSRHHKIEQYIAQMERLKEINPDVAITTDLIVGFPTENREHFEETKKLLDRVQFDQIYAYAYSPRPGTKAAKMPDDVSEKEKAARLNELLLHQLKISRDRYEHRVGKVMEILVEGESKRQAMVTKAPVTETMVTNLAASKNPRVWHGRTSCNRVVNFTVDGGADEHRSLVGRFIPVKITSATGISLRGELVHDAGFADRSGTEKIA